MTKRNDFTTKVNEVREGMINYPSVNDNEVLTALQKSCDCNDSNFLEKVIHVARKQTNLFHEIKGMNLDFMTEGEEWLCHLIMEKHKHLSENVATATLKTVLWSIILDYAKEEICHNHHKIKAYYVAKEIVGCEYWGSCQFRMLIAASAKVLEERKEKYETFHQKKKAKEHAIAETERKKIEAEIEEHKQWLEQQEKKRKKKKEEQEKQLAKEEKEKVEKQLARKMRQAKLLKNILNRSRIRFSSGNFTGYAIPIREKEEIDILPDGSFVSFQGAISKMQKSTGGRVSCKAI